MRYLVLTAVIVLISSCNKDWLDKKSNKALITPKTLQDCQLLLDNNSIMNLKDAAMGEMGSDNYFKYYNDWTPRQVAERNIYIWAPGDDWATSMADWTNEYERLFYANSVLSIVDNIPQNTTNADDWKIVKGSALFFRAIAHYRLVSLFAQQYDGATAEDNPGIPVKLSPDINIKVKRGTLKETFERIVIDLIASIDLLPLNSDFKTRPKKAAAEALLSDVYLTMGNYEKALEYAVSALGRGNVLLNFNNLNPSAASPLPRFNEEVIMHFNMTSYAIMASSSTYVDSVLYASYTINDLRKTLFFMNRPLGYTFKGSYNQNSVNFTGFANDELYLIKAECLARRNDVAASMDVLNALLVTRWRAGTFIPFSASSKEEALSLILAERRKELIFRGRRWNDLKRLNKEPGFAMNLKRILNGVEYSLPPNADRYVLPIPINEIRLNGLEQNLRK